MAGVTIKSYKTERLKEITDNLQKKMGRVGAIIERQAKSNASHARGSGGHPQVQTGRLRASISYNYKGLGMARGKVESPAKSEDGVSAPTEDGVVHIGTNVEYAKIVELGSPHQPPYPFLFPALEATRDEIVKVLGEKVKFGGIE